MAFRPGPLGRGGHLSCVTGSMSDSGSETGAAQVSEDWPKGWYREDQSRQPSPDPHGDADVQSTQAVRSGQPYGGAGSSYGGAGSPYGGAGGTRAWPEHPPSRS